MGKWIIDLIIKAISFIDSFRNNETKLIDSKLLNGITLKSENGFSPAAYIHLTKRFSIYKVVTNTNKVLYCADEHLIYDENMCARWVVDYKPGDKIITESGIETITEIQQLEQSVSMCDITALNENESYYTNGILSHNTTTSSLFMLHYILFNVDKNALVLGNKRKTAVEILDKAKKIFIELPYFLRPGIYKWNEGEIVLDNGCRLMAEATTINSGISFTFHCVLADEFAHIKPTILDKFYNNLFPTITAGKARFMITSTQNGYNLFYRLCKSAEAKENEYGFFKTDWDEVPEWNPEKKCWEKRDEEWHRLQVANYGSEEAFNAQFGTNFDINANTLIDTKIIRKFQHEAYEFKTRELPGVPFSEYFFWHPEYDLNQSKHDWFVITTDISEGIGGDDTVYTFNRLCLRESNKIYTETIGFFKYNKVNAEQATYILKMFCQNYLDINHYLISLEYNLYGELFAKYIMENIEKDPANVHRFNEDVIMKYWNDEMTKYTLGKKITSKTKQLGTNLFKQYYEKNEIVNRSTLFLNQISNFTDSKGNGTYAASFGHDDLVMAQLQMVFVFDNPQYKSLCQMFLASKGSIEVSTTYNPYDFTDLDFMSREQIMIQLNDFYDNFNANTAFNDNFSRLNKM